MFNCFGVEHIPKEIKIFVDDKNAIPSVCKMKVYDSMIWGYFCIEFIFIKWFFEKWYNNIKSCDKIRVIIFSDTWILLR